VRGLPCMPCQAALPGSSTPPSPVQPLLCFKQPHGPICNTQHARPAYRSPAQRAGTVPPTWQALYRSSTMAGISLITGDSGRTREGHWGQQGGQGRVQQVAPSAQGLRVAQAVGPAAWLFGRPAYVHAWNQVRTHRCAGSR